MRTVIIPTNMQPWSCEINGVKYGPYPAGAEMEVPDEVAAVIENYYASLPREKPPETDEEEITRIAEQTVEGYMAEHPFAEGVKGVTSAPTAAVTGGYKIAVLDEEPEVKKDGWIYLIKESAE